MKKILVTLVPHALREESEGSEDDLEDQLERIVENETSKAISTAFTRISSGEGQGTSQTQMSDLVEGMKDLNTKLDTEWSLQHSQKVPRFKASMGLR